MNTVDQIVQAFWGNRDSDPQETLQAAIDQCFPDATDEYKADLYTTILDYGFACQATFAKAVSTAVASVH